MNDVIDIIIKKAWDSFFDEIAAHHHSYTSEQVERLMTRMGDKEREYRAQNAVVLSKAQAQRLYSLAWNGARTDGDHDWLDELFGPVVGLHPRQEKAVCLECGMEFLVSGDEEYQLCEECARSLADSGRVTC